MTRWPLIGWPWISTVITIVVAVSPLGQAFIAGAMSSEALSRNIAQPLLFGALVVALACMALEAWIWRRLARRRR